MASTSSMIRPLTDVGRHKDLRIYLEKEEKWWAVNGQTCNNQGTSATGLIQVYDVTKNESRVVPGIACCLAERDVYDRMTTLLFVCDASKGKLILRIQQLDPSLPGTAFEPVDVSVDMLSVNDCPSAIQVLDSLPIVAIMTTHSMLYFFEIHSGTYLFSRNFFKEQWRVWSNADNMNSFLFHRDNTSKIHRVSINTDDLIGYVRQVLKNDTLSSSIAIRTGLPGADDVLFNDMHAEYKNIAIDE
ncbi:hypothetical protein FRC03_012354 [Tulasnella sp. 419]|nr:hypothetical protein FRC03_012354 [Tulasnella sp. 419]